MTLLIPHYSGGGGTLQCSIWTTYVKFFCVLLWTPHSLCLLNVSMSCTYGWTVSTYLHFKNYMSGYVCSIGSKQYTIYLNTWTWTCSSGGDHTLEPKSLFNYTIEVRSYNGLHHTCIHEDRRDRRPPSLVVCFSTNTIRSSIESTESTEPFFFSFSFRSVSHFPVKSVFMQIKRSIHFWIAFVAN